MYPGRKKVLDICLIIRSAIAIPSSLDPKTEGLWGVPHFQQTFHSGPLSIKTKGGKNLRKL